MLDYVIFNAFIGNHDAHAKNFSLLYMGNSAVLAPLYDVLSTAVYPNLTPKMAMKIGGKYKFSEVQARHWDQFLEAVGLSRAQARKRILALAKSMPITARELRSDPSRGFTAHGVVEQIVTLIEQRCALTERRLSVSGADMEEETEPSA
jgi:serine/threonine-protein kinase HipA